MSLISCKTIDGRAPGAAFRFLRIRGTDVPEGNRDRASRTLG